MPQFDIHKILMTSQHAEGAQLISGSDLNELLSLWPSSFPDFSDAILVSYAKMHPGTIVLTFDEKMKKGLRSLGIPVDL